MSKVIQFKKPKEKAVEERFMETLDKSQLEMFYEIISKAAMEYEELNAKYESKLAECEALKMTNEILRKTIDNLTETTKSTAQVLADLVEGNE